MNDLHQMSTLINKMIVLIHSRTENCLDSEGNTPIHLAVANDNPQCVKLLLNHGANITISRSHTIGSSPPPPLTPSLTPSLSHSLSPSLTPSLTPSLSPSPSFTHSLQKTQLGRLHWT